MDVGICKLSPNLARLMASTSKDWINLKFGSLDNNASITH